MQNTSLFPKEFPETLSHDKWAHVSVWASSALQHVHPTCIRVNFNAEEAALRHELTTKAAAKLEIVLRGGSLVLKD